MLRDRQATTAKECPFEGTCRRYPLHTIPVCLHQQDTPLLPDIWAMSTVAFGPIGLKTDVSPQMTTPEYAVVLKQNLEAAYKKV